MADFKELVKFIDDTTKAFEGKLPAIQDKLLKSVLKLIKELDLNGERIAISADNLRRIGQIKTQIEAIINDGEYTRAVSDFAKAYDKIVSLQNTYFRALELGFSQPKFTNEIKKISITNVVEGLTEKGIGANVTQGISDILTKSITTGGSYASLTEQLNNYLVDNKTGQGVLQRYASTFAKDAINEFGRQYTKAASDDLGLEWMRFSNSLIQTSREWCIAMRVREWVHVCELPKLLLGDFEEFKKIDGKINSKTGLPMGMKDGTDASNIQVLCGGHNCGHVFRPITQSIVPLAVRERVFASAEYKTWKRKFGK